MLTGLTTAQGQYSEFATAMAERFMSTPRRLFPMLHVPEAAPNEQSEVSKSAGRQLQAACPPECQSYSCDFWNQWYPCAIIVSSYGCDCSGCSCPYDVLPPSMPPVPPTSPPPPSSPPAPPSFPSPPLLPLPPSFVLSGLCVEQYFMEGVYDAVGWTQTGTQGILAPYFQMGARSFFIYFDNDCDGRGTYPAQWVLDSGQPNTTTAGDLDGDSQCAFHAFFSAYPSITDQSSPPMGPNEWLAYCPVTSGGYTPLTVTLGFLPPPAPPSPPAPPAPPPTPPSPPPSLPPSFLLMGGICAERLDLQGEYAAVGWTASGAPYFQQVGSNTSYFMFWEPDCDSTGLAPPVWVIDLDEPNVTAANDLDGDQACRTGYVAHSISTEASSPPMAETTWSVSCGGCDDTCRYAFDFLCDDGGPGAEYLVCNPGSDCSDCGTRDSGVWVDYSIRLGSLPPPLPPGMPPPPLPPSPPPGPLLPPVPLDGTLILSLLDLRGNLTDGRKTLLIPSGSHLLLGGMELIIPAGAAVTIASVGDGPPAVIDGGGLSRLLRVDGSVQLERLLLTGGRTDDSNGNTVGGGGIFAGPRANITLVGSTIADCAVHTAGYGAVAHGGGLAALGAHVRLVDSAIRNCTAWTTGRRSHGEGGGLRAAASTVDLINSTISSCTVSVAFALTDAHGGGVSVNECDFRMVGSTVTTCTATTAGSTGYVCGGGMTVLSSVLVMTDSIVTDCTASAAGSYGAMIFGAGVSILLTNLSSTMLTGCTIANCTGTTIGEQTTLSGGGMYAGPGPQIPGSAVPSHAVVALDRVTIAHCVLRSIYVPASRATENSQMHTSRGGGLCAYFTSLMLTDCLITGCTVSATGRSIPGPQYTRAASVVAIYSTGAGIYAAAAPTVTVALFRSTITDCLATSTNGKGVHGGAMYLDGQMQPWMDEDNAGSSATVIDSSIANCVASVISPLDVNPTATAGGVYLGSFSATLTRSSISNCSASATGASAGGAMDVTGSLAGQGSSTLAIVGCTIVSCSAASTDGTVVGGGMSLYSASGERVNVYIGSTIFDRNAIAGPDARGIALYTNVLGDSLVTNCTFRNHDVTSSAVVYAATDLRWHCPLGKWSPLTGNLPRINDTDLADFTGCVYSCPPGTIGDSPSITEAINCPSCEQGYFCSQPGLAAPIPCPVGTRMPAVGARSEDSCLPCGAGQYGNLTGQIECSPCPAGTFTEADGATSCMLCPTGGYCPDAGATSRAVFHPCPAGTYNPFFGASSAASCLTCPAGKANSVPGSSDGSACLDCLPGSLATASGTSQCVPCEPATYQNESGATACKQCKMGSYCPEGSANPLNCESGAGLVNAETVTVTACRSADCRCKAGWYNSAPAGAPVECTDECPIGTDCSSAGYDLASLPVKTGYYRLNEWSADVRRCPDAASNCSNAVECKESTSGCRGTVHRSEGNVSASGGRSLQADETDRNTSSTGCNDGLTGTFCMLCASRDDGKRVYYARGTDSRRAHCELCRQSARDSILGFIALLSIAGAVALLLLCGYRAFIPERRRVQLRHAWHTFTPNDKLKILISFYMIATKIPSVYEVELPPRVSEMLSNFSIVVSFGFNGIGSVLECLGMRGYSASLTIYIFAPFVLALLIFALAFCRFMCMQRRTGFALLEMVATPLLQLIFIAYPLVTNVAFVRHHASHT